MDAAKRKRLEAAGFTVGTVSEFLRLTPEQEKRVELRVALAKAVRRKRGTLGISQTELAQRAGSSQSRIAKVEAGAEGVGLDLMFNILFAAGGGLEDLTGGFGVGRIEDQEPLARGKGESATRKAGHAARDPKRAKPPGRGAGPFQLVRTVKVGRKPTAGKAAR